MEWKKLTKSLLSISCVENVTHITTAKQQDVGINALWKASCQAHGWGVTDRIERFDRGDE